MGKVKEQEMLRQEMAMDIEALNYPPYKGIDATKEQEYQNNKYYGDGHPQAALSKQIAGSHYQMPIQPVEFIAKNNIPYIEGNIIKYVVRHKKKNGKEDLLKAKHYLEMLIEEYK